MSKNYWLMKSEPDEFSIDNLVEKKTTLWEGVRNYQARNFMMRSMKMGDKVLFYHSNAEPPGVAGLARVSSLAIPDPSQFDKASKYFDPKSDKNSPRWHCVEVEIDQKFKKFVDLSSLRSNPKLKKMLVLKKGMRLSIQPVDESDFLEVINMSKK